MLFLVLFSQTIRAEEQQASSPVVDTSVHALTSEGGYLTFYLDNDLFSGTDSNYTNGARVSYITEGKPVINIPFVQRKLKFFSGTDDSAGWMQKFWGFKRQREIEYSYGFALTQMMFTPETLEAPAPPPGERPYAGWLGVGISLHARDSNALNSVEISIGVVGPDSRAQESQDIIHDIWQIDKFQGWDSQIPNEFTLNVTFNQKRRWDLLEDADLPKGLEIDGFHETGYALGNYLTAAHLGATIRVGWNLPVEFSDPRLTLSAHTQKLYSNGNKNENDWSVYALFGARITGIYHDITLDGPVFKNYDTGVDKEHLVGEVYAGFGVRRHDWEFGYVHTYRSKEFKTQNDPQAFGSVAIRKRF